MSVHLTVNNILAATKGKLIQGPVSGRIKGVSIDSRTVKKGDLFIAIKGNRFNGHHFLQAAVKKGAAALILSQKNKAVRRNIPVICVKDTVKALGQVAHLHRKRYKIPVVAITGSAGKTTTKEMASSILSVRYNVLKNAATKNNHIGVPLTLLELRNRHQMVVLEFGTNQPGDIRWLTSIAQPSVALYTNIGESHLQGLRNVNGVLREKWEIVKGMSGRRKVLLNADDPYLSRMKSSLKKEEAVTFGLTKRADYSASDIKILDSRNVEFRVNQREKIRLKTPVRHNVTNAIAAISCGRLFRISYNDIKRILSRFKFPAARQEIRRFRGGWLIDDTYNANPMSFKSAVGTLVDLKTKGRRIVVCADMLELGQKARRLHHSLGRFIGKNKIDLVLTVGPLARTVSSAVKNKNHGVRAYHCSSLNVLHKRLKNYCQAGDAILIKGSRSMHLERTVQFLEKNFK